MLYLCTDMNMSPLVTRKIMFIKKCTNFLSSVIQYLVSHESCGLHYYLIIMKTSQQLKIFVFLTTDWWLFCIEIFQLV